MAVALSFTFAIFALGPLLALADRPIDRIVLAISKQSASVSAPAPVVRASAQQSSASGVFAMSRLDGERAGWNWSAAKRLASDVWEVQIPGAGVYSSFYCGCHIERRGSTGGDVDFRQCGYQPRASVSRASRLEWEHVVPAAVIGRGRSCWSEGAPQCVSRDGKPFHGRKCCEIADPWYAIAATDPVNLVPSVGEVNGDRADYIYGELRGEPQEYGACRMQIDASARIAEPPESRRGDVARIWAYMHQAYGAPVSAQQAEVYRRWMNEDPVSIEEVTINRAIAATGHRANPYVPVDAQEVRF
jgi:deoxyribonuclease-1